MISSDLAAKIKSSILVCIFLALLFGLLYPKPILPDTDRSVYYLWESGHLVLFFLGCHLLYRFFPRISDFTFVRQANTVLLTSSVCIAAIEVLQSYISGKKIEFRDVVADGAGILLYLSFRSLHTGRKRYMFYGIALLLAGFTFYPVCSSFFDEILEGHQFPLLADFETPFEATRFVGKTVSLEISKDRAFHGRHSLKILFAPGPWAGARFEYLPPDWRGYTQLHFAVYNPERQPVHLEILIYDITHWQRDLPYSDLYNHVVVLPAGKWTYTTVPLSQVHMAPRTRLMDMTRISGIGFFVEKQSHPITLYLDDIRLTK